jgi:hypothetical protein
LKKLSLIILLISSSSFAYNLSHYRKFQGPDASSIEVAKERVKKLHALLDTKSEDMSELSESEGVFTQTAEYQRFHSVRVTDYVKRVLLNIADELQIEEQYGAPDVYDPSLFQAEQDEKKQLRRNKFCKRVLGDNFDVIYKEMTAQVKQSEASISKKELPESAGENVIARTELIASYINENIPKNIKTKVNENDERVETSVSLIESIGHLYRVDVYDDVTTKLRFTKDDMPLGSLKPLRDDKEIALSLSMLINIRTELDNYLVYVLSYIVERLEARKVNIKQKMSDLQDWGGLWGSEKVEHAALESDLTLLNSVLVHLQEKYEGALLANQILYQLDPKQIDFLIDLLIQLRGGDIPVMEDIETLKTIVTSSTNIDHVMDYNFYKKLSDELYRLENYLTAERAMKKKVAEVISNIKGE